MKILPLITALILTMVGSALHAQTTLLIQPGDTVPGVTTNGRLSSIQGVTINELDGYAFQGFSVESTSRTNISFITNRSVTSFYTNVFTSNSLITFRGTVTNTLISTNRWNVNGTTNTYFSRIPQIRIETNGPTNSATFTRHIPQGLTSVTNVTILTNRWVSMTGITNYSGIWATGGASNALGLIAKSGDVAPGTSNNFVSFSSPVYNNASAVAFIGYVRSAAISTNGLTNAGAIISTNSGIWSTQPRSDIVTIQPFPLNPTNRLTQVAISGSPAPGTKTNFTSFNSITLPDTGGVIFQATAGTNQGIWVQDANGTVNPVAITGQSLQVGATNKVIRSLFMTMGGFPGPIRSVNQDTGTIIYQAWFTDNTTAWMRVRR